MIKLNLKSLLAGFLAGILVTTVSTAFAAGKTLKKAYFSDIKITVDGKQVQTAFPVATIETNEDKYGTTYIPARPLAEALGARVDWDGATKTVVVASREGQAADPNAGTTGTQQDVPTLKVGETWDSGDGLKITLLKVEPYISPSSGSKYITFIFNIANSTKNALTTLGSFKYSYTDGSGEVKLMQTSIDKWHTQSENTEENFDDPSIFMEQQKIRLYSAPISVTSNNADKIIIKSIEFYSSNIIKAKWQL